MRNNRFKFLAVVGFVGLLFVVFGFQPEISLTAAGFQTDAAAVYKKNCAACHKAKADKFFDSSKTDEQLVDVILKGKKDAKPPMPAYAAKGVTPEKAKALVAYMRKLRTPKSANTNANMAVNANTKTND